ncbi:MAG: FtsQ-type POTRA domain-containing protein [Clostridia bacterium]|nr:FtsQ-type POTRA domain-containing protein [Clostridia bacterium]
MEKRTNDEYSEQLERNKRIMMKKRKKMRAKRRFIVFMFLLICAGIIITALKAPFFNISQIVCSSETNLTEEQILKTAGINTGQNIFSTGVRKAEEKLTENPEIAEAAVRRVFPNKIKIEIKEAVPVAYVVFDSEYLMIDGGGKIIKLAESAEDERLKNLIHVEGIEVVSATAGKGIASGEDIRAKELYKCLDIMQNLGMREKVNYIDIADLSDIKIDYENRIYMLLGSYDKLEYKLKFVKKVIDEKLSEQEKAKFDFRSEKLHVGPREVLEAAEDEETAENDEQKENPQKEDEGNEENGNE